MVKLLVIDWDSFFPNLDECCVTHIQPWSNLIYDRHTHQIFDWSHREESVFIHAMWALRGASFLQEFGALPQLTGEQDHFWGRMNVDPRATLYVADSNTKALDRRVMQDVQEVWLYDAHHDAGYERGSLTDWRHRHQPDADGNIEIECGSWLIPYYLEGITRLHMRYPRWKQCAFSTDGAPLIPLDRQFDDGQPNPVRFDRVFLCRSGAWTPSWCDAELKTFLARAPVRRQVLLDGMQYRHFDREAALELNQRSAEVRAAAQQAASAATALATG